ncbi:MAG: hypothetical protein ACREMA_01000 [Longimicrobiales bacterium]
MARTGSTLIGALSNGQFVVMPFGASPHIGTYNRGGAFLQLYDRRGNGPGELPGPLRLLAIGPGDTIGVVAGRRIVQFAPNLANAKSRTLDFAINEFLPLGGGMLVISSPIQGEKGLTHAIHIVDAGGEIAQSADTIAAGMKVGLLEGNRVLGAARDGGFWTIRVNSSRVERYTFEGKLVRSFTITRRWFTPWDQNPGLSFQVKPVPKNSGIQELPGGRLVVTTLVADANWKPQAVSVVRPGFIPDGIVDTIIDIVDPIRGIVLATSRFDQSIRLASGVPGYAYSAKEVPSGDIVIPVWRIDLAKN